MYITMFARLTILVCILFVGCDPLEPLGEESRLQDDTFGTPPSRILKDTWHLKYVSRQQIAYADIDTKFLDGRLPESVNFEKEGDVVTRHRVLEWGQLQLRDNGYYRMILQYNRYAVKSGQDIGPTAPCRSDIRGLYGVRDGTLILYPDRLPQDHVILQMDALGGLRSMQVPNTCNGLDSGVEFESDILLQNVVFEAVD